MKKNRTRALPAGRQGRKEAGKKKFIMTTLINMLPVMESFYTIQGEGFNSGKAAYFIRLGGCDVGCVWCDVKESWDGTKHPKIAVDKIVEDALKHPSRFAVITGGEPLMHDLTFLCRELHKNKFTIALETSGAYPLTGKFDWICVSPKKFKFPLPELLKDADELKIIVHNKSDFEWAEKNIRDVRINCKLFLQPEYNEFNNVMPLIIEYVKAHPQWEISLQSHKVMNVP
jgi:7-carboxy-7-deazaguanine synthase